MQPAGPVSQSDATVHDAGSLPGLYERYGERSLAFVMSLGLRRADAEDVHHEAWMKIVRSLTQSPFTGNFSGWMHQIMRNAAYDWMRRKTPDPTEQEHLEGAAAHDDPQDDPIVLQEYHETLRGCLEKLSPELRELIQARLAGLDYDAICERHGMTAERAHRRFFTAKQSVTKCVQGRMGGEQ